VILYAFDLLDLNGRDQRELALEERKARLGDLLAPLASGIKLSEHLEGDGATIFRHACNLGCEGIVSNNAPPPIALAE
jgi:bifunctional non-homologous end joining protein LigD